MEKLKILIVDDIIANRYLLNEIIKAVGHSGIQAKNGKEAVEKIETEKPDLVFLDIEMPVMNGLETIRHIRNNMLSPLKNTIVIALTAHNPEIFFDDYKDVQFDEILTKPYTMERVQTYIKKFYPD